MISLSVAILRDSLFGFTTKFTL